MGAGYVFAICSPMLAPRNSVVKRAEGIGQVHSTPSDEVQQEPGANVVASAAEAEAQAEARLDWFNRMLNSREGCVVIHGSCNLGIACVFWRGSRRQQSLLNRKGNQGGCRRNLRYVGVVNVVIAAVEQIQDFAMNAPVLVEFVTGTQIDQRR